MRIRPSAFLRQVFSALATIVKAKSMAAKSKASSMKARLLIFGLLRNKKVLMSAISHKIHALIGQEKEEGSHGTEDDSKAIVVYNGEAKHQRSRSPDHIGMAEPVEEEDDDDDDYPDLRHSLFESDDEDEDDGLGNASGSVIDLVRNSREDGTDFSLEDEIDHVADVFIRRFHRQMKMQKLESFKRYQEMMARSV